MTSQFLSMTLNRGQWQGVWTYFAPPAGAGAPLAQTQEKRSVLTFTEVGPNVLRQTNEYLGAQTQTWEYHQRDDGLVFFEIKDGQAVPGDPAFLEAICFFPGDASFSNGYHHLLPNTPFLSEQGFVVGDRKRRVIVMYAPTGEMRMIVAIRETRGGPIVEDDNRTPGEADLMGVWRGEARMIGPGSDTEARVPTELSFERRGDGVMRHSSIGGETTSLSGEGAAPVYDLAGGRRLAFLPGDMTLLYPIQIPVGASDRAFTVEIGWLEQPDRYRRVIRQYNEFGVWEKSVLTVETRVS
ncbi:MAG: DUF3598 family protein [Dehalococcoidia bacterium]|nr:DUF3598 family protein [Dehalococcoidia bacterium]